MMMLLAELDRDLLQSIALEFSWTVIVLHDQISHDQTVPTACDLASIPR
jgi:hypothetical protein